MPKVMRSSPSYLPDSLKVKVDAILKEIESLWESGLINEKEKANFKKQVAKKIVDSI